MKSIIMVTLDCVRPDHMGFTGYKGVDTPNLDALAGEGVFFSRAICQAPNTWVSHAGIFSGTNPFTHGVRTPYTKLSSRVKTLAQVLTGAGYDTAGFPAHTLMGPALGFDRGFRYFDIQDQDMLISSDTSGHYYFRQWEEMWGKAAHWIATREKPFFVWLHYMGTHELKPETIQIPRDFLDKYAPTGQYYDAKISWADSECAGSIRTFLKENKLEDEVILTLFSDHGDILTGGNGEEGVGRAFHNQHLDEDVMNILWLMHNRELLPPGARVTGQVRGIDIMPTLLELVGVEVPGFVEGKSLVSIIHGKDRSMGTGPAYMENLPRKLMGLRTPEWKLVLTGEKRPGKNVSPSLSRRALGRIFPTLMSRKSGDRTPQLKIDPTAVCADILEKGIVHGLYKMQDPLGEELDVAAAFPEVTNGLREELRTLVHTGTQHAEILDEGDEALIAQKLQELGYMD